MLRRLSHTCLTHPICLPGSGETIANDPRAMFLRRPLRRLFHLITVMKDGRYRRRARRVTALTLQLLRVIEKGVTSNYQLALLLRFLLLYSLPIGERVVNDSIFEVLLGVLFQDMIVPAATFIIASTSQ